MLTVRTAVAGFPVAHSISPQLHNAAYRALGLESWDYGRVEVTEAAFAAFLAGLGPQWRGLSLTMPLKEVALAQGLPTSALAGQIGAANTLTRDDGGTWSGDNTDVHGIVGALASGGVLGQAGHDEATGAALVLGSGATARSVLVALHRLGYASVDLAVRDRPRERTLALARDLGMAVRALPLSQVPSALATARLVVSALPPDGARGVAVACAGLRIGAAVAPGLLLDVVYADWPTPLARAYAAAGGRVVSGFEMLLHQGAEQVRLMTGLEPPLEVMRAAGLQAMVSAAGSGPG